MSAEKICRVMRKEGEAFNRCRIGRGSRKKRTPLPKRPLFITKMIFQCTYWRTTFTVPAVSLPLKMRRK